MTLLVSTTIWGLIESRAAATPDAVFLVDEFDRTVTFEQYRGQVLLTAAGLWNQGVRAGQTVAWQLPTWIESMVLMGAAARLGANQMPLLPILREAELSRLLRLSEAGMWILPSLWRGTDYQALAKRVRQDAVDICATYCDYDLPTGDPDILSAADPPAGENSWLFPTSGTTSRPKLVMHNDRSIMAGGRAFCLAQKLSPADRYGIAFPITHIGGANNLAAALQGGFSLALCEVFEPGTTSESFRRHEVTIAGGGPAFYAAYLTEQRRRPSIPILPKLRFMTGGGAPMPSAMHEQVRDEIGGVGCAHGYGMTEMCIVAMNSPDDTAEHLATTVGHPAPSVQIEIRNSHGVARPGADGEIFVRGPALFKGYLGESGTALDADGWFCTGDVGQLDAHGYLRITGRIKDIVIRKGENISAAELEDVLYTHPSIDEVAIIGLPDDERGERVCAVVCVRPDTSLTLADLTNWCAEAGLMRQKAPEQLEIIDAMPRNPAGKVLKEHLRARFEVSSP